MGGKSSSKQSSSQTTLQGSSEGVVLGSVIQGSGITLTDYFPQDVADAFGKLIDLTGESLNLTRDAGTAALDQVTKFGELQTQPDLSIIREIAPMLVIGLVVVAGILVWRK